GKLVYQTTKKRASGPKCPVTGKRIQGLESSLGFNDLHKSLSALCLYSRMSRPIQKEWMNELDRFGDVYKQGNFYKMMRSLLGRDCTRVKLLVDTLKLLLRNKGEVVLRMKAVVASKQYGQEDILCPLIANVVPTIYTDIRHRKINSNQFSVTEHFRSQEVYTQSIHGVFFFYDFSPIKIVCNRSCCICQSSPVGSLTTCARLCHKVTFNEETMPLLHFLTNVCAIVGGSCKNRNLYICFIYQLYANYQLFSSCQHYSVCSLSCNRFELDKEHPDRNKLHKEHIGVSLSKSSIVPRQESTRSKNTENSRS
ncbi:hypothetical protein IFM89_018696, partial [Coptis chinensis]